jgi:hypothetical protein
MSYMDTILLVCRALSTTKVALKCIKDIIVLVNSTYICSCSDTKDTDL